MTSTHANALPNAATVDVRDGTRRARSTFGRLRFHSTPDASRNPREWTLTWTDAHGAVGDAVRRHFEDHSYAVFTWVVPRTAEQVYVRWLVPPAIQWGSTSSVDAMSGVLEESMVHE